MFIETGVAEGKGDRLGRRARPFALRGAVAWSRRVGAAGMVGGAMAVLMSRTRWTARTAMIKVRHEVGTLKLLVAKVRWCCKLVGGVVSSLVEWGAFTLKHVSPSLLASASWRG